MPVEYTPDQHARLLAAIERFWLDETDEELGIIKRDRIFDFFNQLIGSAAYNQAVADAQVYLHAKLLDLEIEHHHDVRERPPSAPPNASEA